MWQVAPSGDRSRVTHDLATYAGLSLSRDGAAIVTVQYEIVSQISDRRRE